MSQVPRHVATIARWAIFGTMVVTGVACSAAGDGQAFDSEFDDSVSNEAPIRNPVGKATAYPEAAIVNMGYGRCSGAVIAPRVVLTAGHCVTGSSSFTVTTPYATDANGKPQVRTSTKSWTKYQSSGSYVNPNRPDVGLIFFDSGEPFDLPQWPELQKTQLPSGTKAINIGRKNNGYLSNTDLYVGHQVTLQKANGYPYAYASAEVIEPGDSGGPVVLPGAAPHTIVAVNSGAGGGQILARTDAVIQEITQLIDQHGGPGQNPGGGGGSGGSGGSGGGTAGSGGSGTGGGSCNVQEQEPNQPYYAAQPFDNGTVCGSFASTYDEDWYQWTVAGAGVTYDVSVTGSSAQVLMWKKVNGRYYAIGNASPEHITNTSNGSGTYFIAVWSPSGESGDYTLRLSRSDLADPPGGGAAGGAGAAGSGGGTGGGGTGGGGTGGGGQDFDGHSCSTLDSGATGSEPGGVIPVCCGATSAEKDQIQEVFALLNAHRQSYGRAALAYDDSLEAAIQGHCLHMSTHEFFSHSAPESSVSSPWDRAEACGTNAGGENIAWGYGSPSAVMTGWKNSSGHNNNMLNASFKRVGIGYVDGYWGQLFGY